MPITDQVLTFKTNPSNLSPAQYGTISVAEITKMSSAEFLVFKQRLAKVRFRTRFDVAVYEAAVIKAGTTIDLFRRGLGDKAAFATSATEFSKNAAHTNMSRKGEFPQGSLVIITDIVAKKAFTSGLPTGLTDGIITNPKATFPATFDPALALLPWLENVRLDYLEDDGVKVSNYLGKFTQNEGISGAMGASAGGFVQNFGALSLPLPQPRALEGGDDFTVRLTNLADYDASAATGIGQVVTQRIELETVEVIPDRP